MMTARVPRTLTALLFAGAFSTVSAVQADTRVFRSVGENGEVVFSDRAGGAAQQIVVDAPAPATTPSAGSAQLQEILNVADSLEASRLQRERLRLDRERVRAQVVAAQAAQAQAEADALQAENERNNRLINPYGRPARHGYRPHHPRDSHHGDQSRADRENPAQAEPPTRQYRFNWRDRPSD